MARGFHILLVALLTLSAIPWAEGSGPFIEHTNNTDAAAEKPYHSHVDGIAHCATGIGGTCQFGALAGMAISLNFTSVAERHGRAGNNPGVALTNNGPPSPIPIG